MSVLCTFRSHEVNRAGTCSSDFMVKALLAVPSFPCPPEGVLGRMAAVRLTVVAAITAAAAYSLARRCPRHRRVGNVSQAAAATATRTATATATDTVTAAATATAAAAGPTASPPTHGPACPPNAPCGTDADCPAFRGAPRRCVPAACTASICGVNAVTCEPTGGCTRDCLQGGPGGVRGACAAADGGAVVATPTPSPTRKACAPYTVCGRGKPPCGAGRRCRRSRCTASQCWLNADTCRFTACTFDCQANRGYCVDV